MKYQKVFNKAVFCISFIFWCSLANATTKTIGFDDLGADPFGSVSVSPGYSGLNWWNFALIDGITFRTDPYYYFDGNEFKSFYLPKTGYQNGMVSESAVAFNSSGDDAFINSQAPFYLNSLYLTAAWRNDLNVEVTGYLNGVQINSTVLTLSRESPALESFNWSRVDTIKFHSFGGISNGPFEAYNGLQFAMDNVTITDAPIPVPEPEIYALFLVGLGMLGFKSRYKN